MTPIFSLRINRNITAINDGAIIIGTNIKEKRIRFPGKTRSNNSAKEKPRINSKIVTVSANIKVNRMELQKLGSVRMLLKFSKPTG
jgi:hypothetical protein